MLASVVPPLAAAYMGILVYLLGLFLRLDWRPEPVLLIQILTLTTVQAVVMVSGAVVISSQTTSVRAANLLASFIIVPVAELIIGESVIMFWGRYHILWWIVLALLLIAIVLTRMGLRLFNREELLGRELDVLDLRNLMTRFGEDFRAGASTFGQWYRELLRNSLVRLRIPILITAVVLASGYFIGYRYSAQFQLPPELLQFNSFNADWAEFIQSFGMMSAEGWMRILYINIRALLVASLLGIFTFGVLSQILLMVSIGLVGYFAGNLALAGISVQRYLVALVLPHAILEIPAAILAGAAILQLGMAVISLPRGTSLSEGWIRALAEWARVGVGIVLPMLIIAAALEVFVTPRVAIALLLGS